jgi:3-isopropylmalate/(R)-2-methylmalate dehydratase large subunit
MSQTLFEKVWALHTVRTLPNGQTQLFVGLHLIHEVTSPQAFDMLRARGWGVRFPDRTVATVDHIVPTRDQRRPFGDLMAEDMLAALERNTRGAGVPLFDLASGAQGIVHVIGPELGLTQPGMTIACGDSHTSTHGAFGAVAFGIGTSQVRDVLASQCLAMDPLKVSRRSWDSRSRSPASLCTHFSATASMLWRQTLVWKSNVSRSIWSQRPPADPRLRLP